MMKKIIYSLIVIALVGCQNQTDEGSTESGNMAEVAPSQAELDEIALNEQPALVKNFFEVDQALITDEFCYSYDEISQLILHGNESKEHWNKFELADHYLTANHSECGVLLEFMTFDYGDQTGAFLSQMNEGKQQFNFLIWNAEKETWDEVKEFPKPNFVAYFDQLTRDEITQIENNGADYIYINPQTKSATYVFSELDLMKNLGKKQTEKFSSPVRYEYEMKVIDGELKLAQIDLESIKARTEK